MRKEEAAKEEVEEVELRKSSPKRAPPAPPARTCSRVESLQQDEANSNVDPVKNGDAACHEDDKRDSGELEDFKIDLSVQKEVSKEAKKKCNFA